MIKGDTLYRISAWKVRISAPDLKKFNT
ncbi:hypothetical protein ACFS6G_01015 [Peribacillus deserti]